LLDDSKLADMSKIAKQLSKPEATSAIAKRAIAYAKEGMKN